MERLSSWLIFSAALMVICFLIACREKTEPDTSGDRSPEPVEAEAEDRPAMGPECSSIQQDDFTLSRVGANVYVMGQFRGKKANHAPVKNISWVVTDDGVVLIDTGNLWTARAAKRLIASTSKKPIKYIIYTHHHGPHVGGARVLHEPQTQVIAHEDLVLEFDLAREMAPFRARLNSIQFDFDEKQYGDGPDSIYPDITYSSEYSFTLGGTRFELHHADAESRDYTYVYLPREKIIWVADLVSTGAPMVASPMKPVRDDVKWRLALEAIKKLDPNVLIESVKPPICDKGQIAELLDARIAYLGFLHRAVIAEINAGSTAEQAARNIQLPAELAQNPLAWDEYGCLPFNVRGLHQRYAGWFDQNGTHLDPAPAERRAASFIEAMGGGERVLQRAGTLLQRGEPHLAMEYLDLLLDAGDHQAQAHEAKSKALQRLARRSTHNITEQIYRHLAKNEQQRAEAIR